MAHKRALVTLGTARGLLRFQRRHNSLVGAYGWYNKGLNFFSIKSHTVDTFHFMGQSSWRPLSSAFAAPRGPSMSEWVVAKPINL